MCAGIVAILGILAFAAARAAGGGLAAQAAEEAAVQRVRAADAVARRVLEQAARSSPTAAALIARLQRSDLIVTVQTGMLPAVMNGSTRIVAATPVCRHVRVILRIPNSHAALLEVLGHELHHAVEIADMPQVRDELSFAAAYRRIGYATLAGGYFETAGAIEAGRRVSREVSRPGGNTAQRDASLAAGRVWRNKVSGFER